MMHLFWEVDLFYSEVHIFVRLRQINVLLIHVDKANSITDEGLFITDYLIMCSISEWSIMHNCTLEQCMY